MLKSVTDKGFAEGKPKDGVWTVVSSARCRRPVEHESSG